MEVGRRMSHGLLVEFEAGLASFCGTLLQLTNFIRKITNKF